MAARWGVHFKLAMKVFIRSKTREQSNPPAPAVNGFLPGWVVPKKDEKEQTAYFRCVSSVITPDALPASSSP
jgi:hypothetical protein